jgi:ferritin-like metal-binding protein YciE
MSLMTMNNLLEDQILDLYSAEQQIEEALPEMIEAAGARELREAFQLHLEQTRGQSARLREIMNEMGLSLGDKVCRGMMGLLAEGSEILDEQADPDVRDAALIAAAQRVEHYEIAGCACTYAKYLGMNKVCDMLGMSLEEEKETDSKLTKLAAGGLFSPGINRKAPAI